jgi:hypothetical protein
VLAVKALEVVMASVAVLEMEMVPWDSYQTSNQLLQ